MKRGKTYEWIPFYVDKWIFGSTRIELEPAERAVWIDLMALAAKDDGFVRANEKTPYPAPQLAGMLCVPLDLLERSIEKCIRYGKLERDNNGVLYLKNWGHYALTTRHKRRVMSENADIDVPALGPYTYTETDTKTDTNTETETETEIDARFSEFWTVYPKEGRLARKESRIKFGALVKRGELQEFIKGFHGYMDFLKHKRINEKFEQRPLYAKTFLNDRWREYVDFKYEAGL